MSTSKITSNLACNPQSKETIINHIWIENTTNNDIVIDKICERNLCSKETASLYLQEYHKFQYCLGKEFRLNELLQGEMILFPSSIVSRIWRLHQLFTTEYPSLCRDLGFNFISFNPEKLCFWEKSEKEIERLRPVYEKTLSLLKKEFKEELNEQIWPSNYDDMVKQHLLSFHVNLTTYQAIENTVNTINSITKFTEMSITDIKTKIIPQLRKELPSFKETDFILQNPEDQTNHVKETYSLILNSQFPKEMVTHIQNEYLLNEESTQQVIKEYKKFFMMFLVNKNFSQVPSAFVDEIWHTHINFAKVYAKSCEALAGGLISHVPATNIEENEQEIMSNQFKQTMALYESLFGKVNQQYWQLEGEFQDNHQNFFWIDLYDANTKAQSAQGESQFVKVTDNDNEYLFEEQDSISTDANTSINEIKESCNGCTGECNGKTLEKKSCNGCTGECNGLMKEKKSCNGCTGECNGKTLEKKSCNGCTGECNGKTLEKKSCNGCTGECNGKTLEKKSCNGCTGECNGKTLEKKSCNGCTGECNGKAQEKKSCNGCTGECNGKTLEKKSCNGCTGDCNGKTQEKKSCNGCTGECNGLMKEKKSCNGCTGECNGKALEKKSCNGCTGDCNGLMKEKKSCNGCTGECNGKTQEKKSCNGCTGECNGLMKEKKSCNGCTGECNGKAQEKKSCNGCTGECNGKTQEKKSCNGCTGECNGKTLEKKSCNGCTGECNGKALQKKSCNGCTGECNGKTQEKKSCNGCTGECNGKTQEKKSCNGCTGECNGKTQEKKSCNGCTGECNGKTQEKKSCNGCTGECNGKTQEKKSCNGCTGECNGKTQEKKSCNGCTGECNGKTQEKKSCNGCTGECNGKTQEKKSCNGCDGSCNGLANKKKNAPTNGMNAINLAKSRVIMSCLDCFMVDQKAYQRSKQNFLRVEQSAKRINQCGNCGDDEELKKKCQFGILNNSKLTIVQ